MKQRNSLSVLLLAAIVSLTFSCNLQEEQNEAAETTETPAAVTEPEPVQPQQQVAPDKNKLSGDWERTDAPYQIKIAELSEGGTMKAGYFNPKSINVYKASWIVDEGVVKIYIELRDDNYPGSNYILAYFPEQDLLAGQYFQAVEGTTYNVEFKRVK